MIQKSVYDFFPSPPLFEAIALQQVHAGFRCSKSQNNAIAVPSLCATVWLANQPTQKERPDMCDIVNKQAKMLLKDRKTKYLFNDI